MTSNQSRPESTQEQSGQEKAEQSARSKPDPTGPKASKPWWVLVDESGGPGNQNRGMRLKYGIQGPWNLGDPVHERITRRTLERAELIDWNRPDSDFTVWEYIRGVIWNDDPEGLLFNRNPKRTDDFSSGVEFGLRFKLAEAEAKKRFLTHGDSLTGRSHFGDLQFLHGMASREGEPAVQTQASILRWMAFTWAIAKGGIDPAQTVGAVAAEGIAALLQEHRASRVDALFGVNGLGDLRRRAVGSMLHVLQDSYAGGHVKREELGQNRRGRVIGFHAYAGQDHGKHAHDDNWRGGDTDDERLKRVKGAQDAIEQGVALLRLLERNEPWEAVRAHLETGPLALVEHPEPAGPGDDYES